VEEAEGKGEWRRPMIMASGGGEGGVGFEQLRVRVRVRHGE